MFSYYPATRDPDSFLLLYLSWSSYYMKKTTKLEECIQCSFFIDTRADCVLCKFGDELEHRVVDRGTVVACPKNN